MKKLLCLLIATILVLSVIPLQNTYAQQVFSDVPVTHDYYDEIMYLLDNNTITESSKFGLNDTVTREEVAVMVAKSIGLDGTPRDTKFSDVPKSNPNSGYIQSAYEKGILGGYPDGTFKPKNNVTRGQMAVFIANAFKLPNGDKVFKDVKAGQTGYEQIKKLVAGGITAGYADGTFKPNNTLTRAHISLFLVKAIKNSNGGVTFDVVLEFPADRYPQTASHIKSAIGKGETPVCTIDRNGADENRDESLAGIPTKDGYDRDEFPMAMCAEGGEGASVQYVEPSDNRGAGSWVGNQLEQYQDGTRVLIKLVGQFKSNPIPTVPTTPTEPTTPSGDVNSGTYVIPNAPTSFPNCTAMREYYPSGVQSTHPAYASKHDRDNDLWACEK